MAPIMESIEIKRPPEEVFAYVFDLARQAEWQEEIREAHVETEGPTGVGTRVRQKRQVPGGVRGMTSEITEHDPPRRGAFRGVDGSIRPVGTVTVVPVGDGSRVTLELDFEGRGFGKLMLPLVRRHARRQVPLDQRRLKERLEAGG